MFVLFEKSIGTHSGFLPCKTSFRGKQPLVAMPIRQFRFTEYVLETRLFASNSLRIDLREHHQSNEPVLLSWHSICWTHMGRSCARHAHLGTAGATWWTGGGHFERFARLQNNMCIKTVQGGGHCRFASKSNALNIRRVCIEGVAW